MEYTNFNHLFLKKTPSLKTLRLCSFHLFNKIPFLLSLFLFFPKSMGH
ncbi:hypothetical protein F383_05138 [Gossypium arboreum]|uniref:Uncharacterized protein n=1 Tax=Gossypium arboreum TaxID=29729 RepID=A0A0B0N679_GOSAR|nr:hypothetical protein F383_05138 [Gossypium arboreum]